MSISSVRLAVALTCLCVASAATIDVAIVFPRNAAHVSESLSSELFDLLEEVNVMLRESKISHRFRLVLAKEVSWATKTFENDKLASKKYLDEYEDEILTEMKAVGADIGLYYVPNWYSGGIAYIKGGKNFTVGITSPRSTTMAHELGHIMGCYHDIDQLEREGKSLTVKSNGLGVIVEKHLLSFYGSLMAYNAEQGGDFRAVEVPRFSGPNSYYEGKQIYANSRTNCAGEIESRGDTVAAFRDFKENGPTKSCHEWVCLPPDIPRPQPDKSRNPNTCPSTGCSEEFCCMNRKESHLLIYEGTCDIYYGEVLENTPASDCEARASATAKKNGFEDSISVINSGGKCQFKGTPKSGGWELTATVCKKSVYCITKPAMSNHPEITDFSTYNGREKCKFPFLWGGKSYNKCTNAGDFTWIPGVWNTVPYYWCVTQDGHELNF